MKKKLQMEHEEKERTRQELDAHLEDTDGKEKPRDTLDVEEKIQEALDGAIERKNRTTRTRTRMRKGETSN